MYKRIYLENKNNLSLIETASESDKAQIKEIFKSYEEMNEADLEAEMVKIKRYLLKRRHSENGTTEVKSSRLDAKQSFKHL